MDFLNRDFIEYLILLNKNEVKYVVVGGMAVNIHGYRRSTGDMDLFVEPSIDNHMKLRKVHLEFGMHMGEMDVLEYFLDTSKYDVFTFGASPIQIDIMTACKGLTFDEAYINSIKIELDDNLIANVIHYNELIIAKKASGRLRDLADIEELEKIKKSDSI
jgi:hypothetical protein